MHTPGPWHYEAKDGEVHSLFGSICTVHGWDNPDDETVPNAELLASAPLLQEQVRILRKALERFADFPVDGNENECAWRALDEIEREAKAALEATKEET